MSRPGDRASAGGRQWRGGCCTVKSRHEREEKEGGENRQVNDALQHGGASGAERDDPDEQGERQHQLLLRTEAKLERLTQPEGDRSDRRNGEADRGKSRAERQV